MLCWGRGYVSVNVVVLKTNRMFIQWCKMVPKRNLATKISMTHIWSEWISYIGSMYMYCTLHIICRISCTSFLMHFCTITLRWGNLFKHGDYIDERISFWSLCFMHLFILYKHRNRAKIAWPNLAKMILENTINNVA